MSNTVLKTLVFLKCNSDIYQCSGTAVDDIVLCVLYVTVVSG